MKYFIEYYITEWRYILRGFDDKEYFESCKLQMQARTGSAVSWNDAGKDIIIPMDKIMLVRAYVEDNEESGE